EALPAHARRHPADVEILPELQCRKRSAGDVVGAHAGGDGADTGVAAEDDQAFGFDPSGDLIDGSGDAAAVADGDEVRRGRADGQRSAGNARVAGGGALGVDVPADADVQI